MIWHTPEEIRTCKECQASLFAYGISYYRADTGEHIKAPDILLIYGPTEDEGVAVASAEAVQNLLEIKRKTENTIPNG